MRMDELLDELDQKEADLLCIRLEQDNENKAKKERNEVSDEKRLNLQEQMVLEKIHGYLEKEERKNLKEKAQQRGHFRKKRWVVLAVAAVFLMGTVVVAAAEPGKWLADILGFSENVEETGNGCIMINKSTKCDGITITAAQAIGDRDCQWIEIDTDIPFDNKKEEYYRFEENAVSVSTKKESTDTGGRLTKSYSKNGFLSFIIYIYDCKNVNHAKINIKLGKLYQYEKSSKNPILVSAGQWELSWKNDYSENAVTKKTDTVIEVEEADRSKSQVTIETIEISPVSLRISAKKKSSTIIEETGGKEIEVEEIVLKDGTILDCRQNTICKMKDRNLDIMVSFHDLRKLNVADIDYIVMEGTKIDMK